MTARTLPEPVCINPAHDHYHDWKADGYDMPTGCCSDCSAPMFYDDDAGDYSHTAPDHACFLAAGAADAATSCRWVTP